MNSMLDIIQSTIIIALLISSICYLLVIIVNAYKMHAKKKAGIQKIINDFKINPKYQMYNVHFSTQTNFKKMHIVSGVGLLIFGPNRITYIGNRLHYKGFKVTLGEGHLSHFNRKHMETEWYGFSFFNNFGHWFCVRSQGKEYYFTAFTNPFFFTERTNSKKLYDATRAYCR